MFVGLYPINAKTANRLSFCGIYMTKEAWFIAGQNCKNFPRKNVNKFFSRRQIREIFSFMKM